MKMKFINSFALLVLVLSLLVLIGCGGSSTKLAGTPTGTFNNASLQGSYAYSFAGNNSYGFFAVTGSFQADGNGHITSGVEDINSGLGVFTNIAVSGTYTVQADGRGTATINTPTLGSMGLDFVVISSKHALLARFDGNGTGSGTLDLQDPTAFSNTALQGAFAFGLSGVDINRALLSEAGNFTADGSSAITAGIQDFNDNGIVTTNLPFTGSYSVSGTNGRGSATLNTNSGMVNLTFYIVEANHLKLIETDPSPLLAGDAYRQQGSFSNASLSGPYVFTLGGDSTSNPFVAGGIFNADGNGNVPSGTEDVNNSGNIGQNISVAGNYSIAANGRGTLTLNSSTASQQYVIYPSTGGLQMLQLSSTIVSSGTAYPQQASAFSNATIQGVYGLSFIASNGGSELDSIAQFSATGSGSLSGAQDFNNAGSLSFDLALNGNYSLAANGRGTATLKTSAGNTNFIIYGVNSSRVLFIEVDTNQIAIGDFEHQ